MDYRLQVRHLMHDHPISEVSLDLGIDQQVLEDVLACRVHLEIGDLLRLVSRLGGELAARPHVVPDAANGEPVLSIQAAEDERLFPSKGLRPEGLFDQAIPYQAT